MQNVFFRSTIGVGGYGAGGYSASGYSASAIWMVRTS